MEMGWREGQKGSTGSRKSGSAEVWWSLRGERTPATALLQDWGIGNGDHGE